ncbi:hypothetical protein DL768_008731 [Monosporascus sp. mg162]|nr:hypothetical protein DL768_008731 [Monosporascus sp. mg162]
MVGVHLTNSFGQTSPKIGDDKDDGYIFHQRHIIKETDHVAPEFKAPEFNVPNGEPRISMQLPNDILPLSPVTSPPSPIQNRLPMPIAICGMAMRLPGGVSTDTDFWRLLIEKKDARCKVPYDRYNVDGFKSKGRPTHGYFLDHIDLAQFDAACFSMTRSEVEKMDPQHRILLELVREAFESAGETNWRGTKTGVYIGSFGEDWLELQTRDPQESTKNRVTGYGDYLLANRISYEYDLKGPSVTVKTACSSSLVGLDMAFKALQLGEISSAIIGGANLIMSPRLTSALHEQGVLSPKGSSCTFSADVDGYARGEALNTIYIKRFDDAVRDGNPIRAVIRSTATNFDGKTPGIAQPSSEGQEALIRACYEAAGIDDFGKTAFVECHGTGTPIGDPIEAAAVSNVFGESGVYVGSVKVLPFESGGLQVPTNAVPWPSNRYERASVNSFGIGGVNAPQQGIGNLQNYIQSHPDRLEDVAYTLNTRREYLPYRSFAVTDGLTPPVFSTPTRAPKAPPEVIFVFTGQGAQWATMGTRLMLDFPSVLSDLALMDKALSELPEPPAWTIEGELRKSKDISRINKAELCQPLCTAIQIVIVNLLRTSGISPAAVVGHSSGEVAAAYASGALSLQEAIIVAYLRGLAFTKQSIRPGAMAAVGLGRDSVRPYLVDGVVIACENSPLSVTLSGDEEGVDAVVERIMHDSPDVFARRLHVEMAYHSPHMKEAGEQFERMLGSDALSGLAPIIPFVSTQTNEIVQRPNALNAAYWRTSYDHPVLFHTALEALLATRTSTNPPLLLEIGPHSALAGPIRQILKAAQLDAFYVPTLVRNENETCSMLNAIGQVFLKGVNLHFDPLNPGGRVLTDLPTYPWDHKTRHWYESRLSKQYRLRRFPHHDLLGSRVHECSDLEPVWRNVLRLDDVPWCCDHVIDGNVVFPGAGYMVMAGEAIRQISGTGVHQDFTIRDFVLSAALTLRDSTPAEILFSMRPFRLTTSLDSDWYEFTVMSFNVANDTWTRHCAGQVRAGSEHSVEAGTVVDLPRKVKAASWYSLMRKVGMNYGPCFQGLQNISAHPLRHSAVAHIANTTTKTDSVYQLHPATLDACIQLFTTAACKGQARSFGKAPLVPTRFGKVYVKFPRTRVSVQVNAKPTLKRGIEGSCFGVADNDVVLRMEDVKLVPLGDGDSPRGKDTHAGVRLQWKPDIEFQGLGSLVRPAAPAFEEALPLVQKLVLLCSIEARNRLEALSAQAEHLSKFFAWLDVEVAGAASQPYQVDLNIKALLKLSSPERVALIAETAEHINETNAAVIGVAVCRIFHAIEGIFRGEIEPLALLREGDVLTELYTLTSNIRNCREFLRLFSHSKPHLRILEIGAGMGATTATVLDSLASEFGERMYWSYTLTDTTTAMLDAAQEKFRNVQNMEVLPLDIGVDPMKQGYEPETFDLVIATYGLHGASSLDQRLANIRRLLRPNGKLLLQELSSSATWVNFIMGALPGWHLNEFNSLSAVERWKAELSKAGFADREAVILEDNETFPTSITIVASHRSQDRDLPAIISLLSGQPTGHVATAVYMALERHGFAVKLVSLADVPHGDVIPILDFEQESPFISDITPENYALFKGFVSRLQTSSGILWLTKACQIRCTEPQYAQILGLARTMRSELAVDIATLELDDDIANSDVVDIICKVYRKFQHRMKEGDVDPEYEYALANGTVYIPRFHWISVVDELAIGPSESGTSKNLEIGKRGSLKTLQWVDKTSNATLTGNEVVVEVRADVLMAMGIIEGERAEANGLGCECSGVIKEIGSNVQDLMVGDRVCVGAPHTYATMLRTTSDHCAKMPDDLSFEDGATMPCAYATVVHGLLDLAKLERGQTVLIHSACGGIGIAAINICRMIGAEIYATVGTEEKVDYLVKVFNVPREHIFNSRDSSFLPGLMRATGGRGADVALNSLSGDLLHTTWKCVAEFGSMVEIGKRDFMGQGRLAMDLFESNRSFFGVDLAQMYTDRPKKIKNLLERIMSFYRQGAIYPIQPTKCFDAGQVEDAFRCLQMGQHIGKLVVRIPENHSLLSTTKARSSLSLRSDASYLVVGGLGGLGRSVLAWLAEHGAKNLIVLSRSGIGNNQKITMALVEELAALGCSIQVMAGSVAHLEDVRRVIRHASLPVAGVIQMSMVLRDSAFAQMTHEDWEAAVTPKVQGTWNLHTAFADHCLDFLVLFSSISGTIGNPGQANYAAANTFLDAFVQFRHGRNLPASVLDVGVMGDVGYVSQNQAIMDHFKARAAYVLEEQDLLDSLELAIRRSRPPAATHRDRYSNESHLGIGFRMTRPISSPENRATWKRDIRMSLYRNLEVAGGGDSDNKTNDASGKDDNIKDFIAAAANDPRVLAEESSVALISQHIGMTLLSFMMKPAEELDVKASPAATGMDSLVAIELRNWCRQRFGLELTVLEIMGAGSIERLGASVARGLAAKLSGGKEDRNA